MYARYQPRIDFVNTESEAKALCDRINAEHTPYMRKKHPAHYTDWTSKDGQTHKFAVFYQDLWY